jgi:hypothetical protein
VYDLQIFKKFIVCMYAYMRTSYVVCRMSYLVLYLLYEFCPCLSGGRVQCTCVCIYMYMCVCVYIYIYVCVCVCMYTYICVCVYIYIYMCICTYLLYESGFCLSGDSAVLCIYASMYLCIYRYTKNVSMYIVQCVYLPTIRVLLLSIWW